ncbi:MAG: redoxin domain-containing protein [Syntrophobacteraceae bacterium]|jgi:thiol-disulfide isomerase/thioredoxin
MGLRSLRIPIMLLFLLCLSNSPLPALFAQNTPDEGEMFPELKLAVPQKMEQREYLNIDQNPFLLSKVDSEVLIVEIFSLYCPYCQKEAPNVNALFDAISASPELKSRVKVLGIGAGNSPFEVNAFRDLFTIEFPLIPDGDFAVHKMLGQVRTPYFFVLWKKPAGWLVVYSRVGSIGDPRAFLELIFSKIDANTNTIKN